MSTNNYDSIQYISEKQKSTHENTWSEKLALNIGIHGTATLSISEVFFQLKWRHQEYKSHILCNITLELDNVTSRRQLRHRVQNGNLS
jgi:hypothetical protein